jgi:hypothetical protein
MEYDFVDVPGWPGYSCNRMGEVKGIHGRILTPQLKGSNRLRVALSKDGKQSTIHIHKIIGATFLGAKPNPRWTIDHIDHRQPLNNCLTNLRWASKETQQSNTGIRKDNESGVRGLVKHTKGGWHPRVNHEGLSHRKYFVKKLDAFNWLRDKRIELGLSVEEHIFGSFIEETE